MPNGLSISAKAGTREHAGAAINSNTSRRLTVGVTHGVRAVCRTLMSIGAYVGDRVDIGATLADQCLMRFRPWNGPTARQHRVDSVEDRRREGRCLRCGLRPANPTNCAECQDLARKRYHRNLKLAAERKQLEQAEAEARRRRPLREVTINGQTFVVTNSYETPSSSSRVQSAPNPFLK